MIPKIIHYCWFGGKPLDDMALKCMESWKKYCPDYELMLWNEENFDINSNEYVREAYENKKWAFVSDYVRLYAIYNYGGIYMDTDVEVIKNLDDLLYSNAFIGFESKENIGTALKGGVKGSELFLHLLEDYDNRKFVLPDGSFDTTTNVKVMTKIISEKYSIELDNNLHIIDNVVTIYPADYFCPKSYETLELNITQNTYCIHHFNGSWLGSVNEKRKKKKEMLINKYGVEKGLVKYKKWIRITKPLHVLKNYGLKQTLIKILRKARN